MDKFEEAFKKISKVNLATHIELWGEPKTEKLYFEAGQQSRQTELDQLKNLLEKDEYAHNLYYENANLQTLVEEKDKRVAELESRLNAVMALSKMRAAVVKAENWSKLRPQIKNAIKCLDRKEKALRGAHE